VPLLLLPAESDTDAAADGKASGQQGGGGSLVEMTVDSSGFSTARVDASLFSVPVDFKAEAPTKGARQ
jgi:hypothetical protein